MNTDIRQKHTYIDYLRVTASFAVIMIHTIAENWGKVDVFSYQWKAYNFMDSIVRWCVPVFVMISGALFLNRQISIKRIYNKYLFRIFTAFIFWGIIYGLEKEGSFTVKFYKFLNGPSHFWYLTMLAGLYMCIPFFRAVIEDKKRVHYFLILTLLFNFLVPSAISIIQDFGGSVINRLMGPFIQKMTLIDLSLVIGYSAYFISGYFFSTTDFEKKQRVIIYFLGILGFAATIFLSQAVTFKNGEPSDRYYGYLCTNVMMEAAAVFIWFKYRSYSNAKLNVIMNRMSKYSFGAYAVHVLILHQLNYRNILSSDAYPVLSSLGIGLITFVGSYLISALLNNIPFLKKYIV